MLESKYSKSQSMSKPISKLVHNPNFIQKNLTLSIKSFLTKLPQYLRYTLEQRWTWSAEMKSLSLAGQELLQPLMSLIQLVQGFVQGWPYRWIKVSGTENVLQEETDEQTPLGYPCKWRLNLTCSDALLFGKMGGEKSPL